jgi:hypothetical protein
MFALALVLCMGICYAADAVAPMTAPVIVVPTPTVETATAVDYAALAIHILTSLFAGTLALLVTHIGMSLARRFGIEASDAKLEHLQDLAEDGIHFAEDWANKKLGENGIKPSGNDKLDKALQVVKNLADSSVVQSYTDDKLKTIIQAAFAKNRTEVEANTPDAPVKAV